MFNALWVRETLQNSLKPSHHNFFTAFLRREYLVKGVLGVVPYSDGDKISMLTDGEQTDLGHLQKCTTMLDAQGAYREMVGFFDDLAVCEKFETFFNTLKAEHSFLDDISVLFLFIAAEKEANSDRLSSSTRHDVTFLRPRMAMDGHIGSTELIISKALEKGFVNEEDVYGNFNLASWRRLPLDTLESLQKRENAKLFEKLYSVLGASTWREQSDKFLTSKLFLRRVMRLSTHLETYLFLKAIEDAMTSNEKARILVEIHGNWRA